MATLYTKTNPPTVHESERVAGGGAPTWRLVHDGTKVLSLHQSTGVTSTINNMVVGTKEEVDAEIAALKLTPLPAKPVPRKRIAPVKPTAPAPVKPTAPAPVKPTAPAPVKPTAPAPVKPTTPAPVKPTTPAPVK